MPLNPYKNFRLDNRIDRKKKHIEVEEWFGNFEPSEVEDMLVILENIEVVLQTEVNSMVEVLSKELKKIFKGDFTDVVTIQSVYPFCKNNRLRY